MSALAVAAGIPTAIVQQLSDWTVTVGPWTLPPAAWIPPALLLAWATLRVRAQAQRGEDFDWHLFDREARG